MFNSNNTLLGSSLLTIPEIGYVIPVIADFERITGSTSGSQLTMSRAATAGDIGKVVAIKEARNFPTYRVAPLTWNGIITGVTAGVAIIESPLSQILIDVSNKQVLIGTNNFDVIQTALDYCTANSIIIANLNYTGTAYVVPEFSTIAPGQTHTNASYRGLSISNNLTIKGLSKTGTILKWGTEDVMKTGDATTEFNYAALTWGSVSAKTLNLRIEAPDRLTTRTNSLISCLRSKQIAGGQKSFEVNNTNIGGYGVNARDNGWHGIFECSLGGDASYTVVNRLINSSMVGRVPVNQFNQNNFKTMVIRNLDVVGGGSKEFRPPYLASASITIGTNILTVNSPEFSFYDFNSYAGANPQLIVGGVFTAEVVSVTNYNTAVLNLNAPSTFTSADLFVKGRGFVAEGHAFYCHPNVGLDIDGLTISDCYKLSMHQHSGGGVGGNPEIMSLKNIVVIPTSFDANLAAAGGSYNSAWEMDRTNLDLPYFTIDNCDLFLYSNNSVPVLMTNTNIRGGQFGSGVVTNCTGYLDARANENITFNNIQGGSVIYVYTINDTDKTTTITNCGNTTRLAEILMASGRHVVINNVSVRDISFTQGMIGVDKTFSFTNLDVRGHNYSGFMLNKGYLIPYTTGEINQFIAQSTFVNCTCSLAVWNLMVDYGTLRNNFTIT